jgi:hypothetical protein
MALLTTRPDSEQLVCSPCKVRIVLLFLIQPNVSNFTTSKLSFLG